jgi:hypothetical protein
MHTGLGQQDKQGRVVDFSLVEHHMRIGIRGDCEISLSAHQRAGAADQPVPGRAQRTHDQELVRAVRNPVSEKPERGDKEEAADRGSY